MQIRRAQEQVIRRDLEKKMVWIVGPRQAGKTSLARHIASSFQHPVYLNYDRLEDRQIMVSEQWLPNTDLLVLDECHKMPQWKNFLKGVYDTKPQSMRMLVTGSARLDVLSNAGDSLVGRYFCHRLLPFTLAEFEQVGEMMGLDRLMERGGFPEPLLAEDPVDAERWRMQYLSGIIRVDLSELGSLRETRVLPLLIECLRARVGSPISYASLARDLELSSHTVKRYIELLEALYVVFRVTPYAKDMARSLLKAPKLYFYDVGFLSGNVGAQFENMVALSLYKTCLIQQDLLARPLHLHYLRTKEQKEVDFVLSLEHNIQELIEVKHADAHWSSALRYFSDKYHLPGIQVVQHLKQERQEGRLTMRRGEAYLRELSQNEPLA